MFAVLKSTMKAQFLTNDQLPKIEAYLAILRAELRAGPWKKGVKR